MNTGSLESSPAAQRPLAGTVVVEIAGIGPAPFACMLLADLGARVIRVDRAPGREGPGGVPGMTNGGKESIAVDLKHPDGVAVVLELARTADVLVEGFRPGVAERLGIGPGACLAANPRLVYGRMTGWGQDGPLAQTAGHDINYLAVTGALAAVGRAGGPPQVPMNLLGDYAGGSLYLVTGVLAALLQARATGAGQVVDAAIVDGVAHLSSFVLELLSAGLWADQRGVNALDTGQHFYDVYETSDGEYMAVGAVEPQFYAQLLQVLGLAGVDGAPQPGHREYDTWMREALARTFKERTRAEWTVAFEGTDACVAPVLSWREAAEHPHLQARGTYGGLGARLEAASAPRFASTQPGPRPRPPAVGQDTTRILAGIGLPAADLLARGVVHQADDRGE